MTLRDSGTSLGHDGAWPSMVEGRALSRLRPEAPRIVQHHLAEGVRELN